MRKFPHKYDVSVNEVIEFLKSLKLSSEDINYIILKLQMQMRLNSTAENLPFPEVEKENIIRKKMFYSIQLSSKDLEDKEKDQTNDEFAEEVIKKIKSKEKNVSRNSLIRRFIDSFGLYGCRYTDIQRFVKYINKGISTDDWSKYDAKGIKLEFKGSHDDYESEVKYTNPIITTKNWKAIYSIAKKNYKSVKDYSGYYSDAIQTMCHAKKDSGKLVKLEFEDGIRYYTKLYLDKNNIYTISSKDEYGREFFVGLVIDGTEVYELSQILKK